MKEAAHALLPADVRHGAFSTVTSVWVVMSYKYVRHTPVRLLPMEPCSIWDVVLGGGGCRIMCIDYCLGKEYFEQRIFEAS